MGIALIKKGITLIIHVARVITGKTKDLAFVPADAIELKFQIDSAAVMLDFHNVDDRPPVSSSKVLCIARE
jgi:hypothetical protein